MSWTTFPVGHSPKWMVIPQGPQSHFSNASPAGGDMCWGCMSQATTPTWFLSLPGYSYLGPKVAFGKGEEQRQGLRERPHPKSRSWKGNFGGNRRLSDTYTGVQAASEPASVSGQIATAVHRAEEIYANPNPVWNPSSLQRPSVTPGAVGQDGEPVCVPFLTILIGHERTQRNEPCYQFTRVDWRTNFTKTHILWCCSSLWDPPDLPHQSTPRPTLN